MASFVYNSALENAAKGLIDFDTDTFKMMLVTSSYSANKDTHEYRDDVTNEVANGNGYTTGGATTACTVAKDNATDRITVTFAATSWTTSTITAAAAVVYKSRGGASSADELVFYNDFGGNVSSSNATFSVGSTVLLYQN
jgi:hypothetical protein